MEHDDKTQADRSEHDRANRESNVEKAEGSLETVNSDIADNQGGRGSSTQQRGGALTEEAVGQADDAAGGISNRPLEQERHRQGNLPPRGERREGRNKD